MGIKQKCCTGCTPWHAELQLAQVYPALTYSAALFTAQTPFGRRGKADLLLAVAECAPALLSDIAV